MKDKENALQEYDKADAADKKGKNQKKRMAIAILLVSFVVLLIYRLSMALDAFLYGFLGFNIFRVVICVYMIALTMLVVVYIVYNRGFSRRGLTPEMLPDTWDIEKKEEFIESAERRLYESRWMLVLIVAFLVNFFVDALELFVIGRFL